MEDDTGDASSQPSASKRGMKPYDAGERASSKNRPQHRHSVDSAQTLPIQRIAEHAVDRADLFDWSHDRWQNGYNEKASDEAHNSERGRRSDTAKVGSSRHGRIDTRGMAAVSRKQPSPGSAC